MANYRSHSNRIIAVKLGKFEIDPHSPMDREVWQKVFARDEDEDLKKTEDEMREYIRNIRHYQKFYGNLAVGTCMTEFSIGFFYKLEINTLFLGIEKIGAFGFVNNNSSPIFPSYVSEKLGIPLIDAHGVADFLNLYFDKQEKIFGEYLEEYMK